MFCNNCGEKLDEGTRFCTKCGTAANAEATSDTEENTPTVQEQQAPNEKKSGSGGIDGIVYIATFILLIFVDKRLNFSTLIMPDTTIPGKIVSFVFFMGVVIAVSRLLIMIIRKIKGK